MNAENLITDFPFLTANPAVRPMIVTRNVLDERHPGMANEPTIVIPARGVARKSPKVAVVPTIGDQLNKPFKMASGTTKKQNPKTRVRRPRHR